MNVVVSGLTKVMKKKQILSDVHLHFEGVYGLIGPNGAGKTTLMKILAGLESFQKGQVSLNNKVIEKSAYIRRYDLIGYLSQDFMVFPELTIYEVLEHIAHLHGAVPLQIPASIKTVLEEVNLSHHAQKKMRELSGGMRRRVGIAQLLLRKPRILLFDEPQLP
ncbi:hypothetical protein JCM19045_4341 [Bacillus sp. JCM 19045]|nr:hypothetical protein JCM19045_4341 [Bacillus sp. JCM 19045]